jgi:hypothetical protein
VGKTHPMGRRKKPIGKQIYYVTYQSRYRVAYLYKHTKIEIRDISQQISP